MKKRKKYMWGTVITVFLTVMLLVVLNVPLPDAKAVLLQLAEAGGALTEKTDAGVKEDIVTAEPVVEIEPEDNRLVYQEKEASESISTTIGEHTQQEAGKDISAQESVSADTEKNVDHSENTFQTVTEDYFSDALFIGDSRTVGMQQSGLLANATYYAKTGIGIGAILNKNIVSDGGVLMSVKNALPRHSFGKVYVMIGINDMSSGDVEWYIQQYEEILETIRSTQPQAVIYIQGNIPMSYRTQDFNGSLTNENLRRRNEAARTLADNETIFYLDTQDIYADINGHLAQNYTSDGLHVKAEYYDKWVEYLKTHAVVR